MEKKIFRKKRAGKLLAIAITSILISAPLAGFGTAGAQDRIYDPFGTIYGTSNGVSQSTTTSTSARTGQAGSYTQNNQANQPKPVSNANMSGYNEQQKRLITSSSNEVQQAYRNLNQNLSECGDDTKCRLVAKIAYGAKYNALQSQLKENGISLNLNGQTAQNQNAQEKPKETMTTITTENREANVNTDSLQVDVINSGSQSISPEDFKAKVLENLRDLHARGLLMNVPESEIENMDASEVMALFGIGGGSVHSESGEFMQGILEHNGASIRDALADGYASLDESEQDSIPVNAIVAAGAGAVAAAATAGYMMSRRKEEDYEEDYGGEGDSDYGGDGGGAEGAEGADDVPEVPDYSEEQVEYSDQSDNDYYAILESDYGGAESRPNTDENGNVRTDLISNYNASPEEMEEELMENMDTSDVHFWHQNQDTEGANIDTNDYIADSSFGNKTPEELEEELASNVQSSEESESLLSKIGSAIAGIFNSTPPSDGGGNRRATLAEAKKYMDEG